MTEEAFVAREVLGADRANKGGGVRWWVVSGCAKVAHNVGKDVRWDMFLASPGSDSHWAQKLRFPWSTGGRVCGLYQRQGHVVRSSVCVPVVEVQWVFPRVCGALDLGEWRANGKRWVSESVFSKWRRWWMERCGDVMMELVAASEIG
eukprot:1420920-Amphidinium_carterae.4